jgi:putative NADH-flavin reductase
MSKKTPGSGDGLAAALLPPAPPMRLLLLGATGRTGARLLARASSQGHDVSVVVRDPRRLDARQRPARLLSGSATDAALLDHAVAGRDAVLCALGPRSPLELLRSQLMRRSIPSLTEAMERNGVARLIVLSALGVGESRRYAPRASRLAFSTILRQVGNDKQSAEAAVRASALDWTIVYPPALSDGPATGAYRHGETLRVSGRASISRADVAEFMLGQLTDTTYSRRGAIIGP